LKLVKLFEAVLGCADFTLSGIVEHFDMSSLCLEMFADANLAGSETSARSTSGGVVFVVSPSGQTRFPLGWLCQRQTSTSTSTAESEVVSLSKVTSSLLLPLESTWDQLVSRPIMVYGREDNMACIAIVKSGWSTSLRFIAKHQRVSIASLAEQWSAEHRCLTHIASAQQRADGLTKLMNGQQILRVHAQLGVGPRGLPLSDEFFDFSTAARVDIEPQD
jgi:hypothetical protein